MSVSVISQKMSRAGWFVDNCNISGGPVSTHDVNHNRRLAAFRRALFFWKDIQRYKGQFIVLITNFPNDEAVKDYLTEGSLGQPLVYAVKGERAQILTDMGIHLKKPMNTDTHYLVVIMVGSHIIVTKAPYDKLAFFGSEATYTLISNMINQHGSPGFVLHSEE